MKTLTRVVVFLAALGGGALCAVVAGLWFFPGDVFRYGASFARRAGVTVSLPAVSGNPAAGWLFEKPSAEGPGFSVSMRRLFIDVSWSSLLHGAPGLDALWIDGLDANIRPVEPPPAPAAKKPAGGPMTLPGIADLRITDGRFTLHQKDADPVEVRRIQLAARVRPTAIEVSELSLRAYQNTIAARGTYDVVTKSGKAEVAVPECLHAPGAEFLEQHCVSRTVARVAISDNRLTLENFSTSVAASTVTAQGAFTLSPFGGHLRVSSRGPFVLNAEADGDPRGWNVTGEARRDVHALTFTARVGLGAVPEYVFDVRAADIPASLVPGLPPAMGRLSGRVNGLVRGKKPGEMNGAATLHLGSTAGPTLDGALTLASGLANADIAVSSGGLSGQVAARWDLGRSQGHADADLEVRGKGLQRWTGVSADGRVKAALDGRMPNVAWRLDADLRDIQAGALSVDKASVSGRGTKLSPPAGRVTAEVSGLRQEDQRVDAAKVTVDGSLARHAIEMSVTSEGRIVQGKATASLSDGRWKSTWSEFLLKIGDTWTARAPFELTAGAGGGMIRGLRLVSGASRLDADGGVAGGRFQDLRVRADAVSIAPLAEAFHAPFPVAGALTLNAALMGPVGAPEGTVTAKVASFKVRDTDAGALSADARMAGRRVEVREIRLEGPAGLLVASGSVPMSFAGKNAPPVRLHVKTDGLNPAALPLPAGMTMDKARLDGDLTVNAVHGDFSADGRLTFAAAKFEMEDDGVKLHDVDVQLTADGRTLTIRRAVARTGKKGTLALDGTVSAREAALALRARGFEVNHPAGIFVRTDADLALSGAWDAPRVTGTVDIQKADIQPGKAKKKKKGEKDAKAAKPAPTPAPRRDEGASPLSADVRIVFNNNVWYKDGQSAIEFKGNLNARKDAGGDPQLFGTIETIRGEYIFYGRAFKFETAKLVFSGESPPDPAIDVAATYVTDQNNVKVHLTVKGTLSKPEIALTSEPPMEETDIVSVLVTGAPRGQGSGGGAGEDAARQMAANFLAEKLRSKLQSRLSVDQLKFKLTDQGAAEVTVGQNVTDNLYISYARTLGAEGERRLNAEYTLTPRWSLNGQTSSIGRYVIDLLFKYGFH